MAWKTFISYKYADSKKTRDDIIDALGEDATYYQGETSESPNLDDFTTETIKSKLSDMIFDTSVLIVVISPNVDDSDWVKWEINYATSRQTRNGRQSQPNGIVKVVKEGCMKYVGEVNELIDEKSNSVTVDLDNFMKNPQEYIEQAYNQRKTD